jgi:uncharacterized protein YpmB
MITMRNVLIIIILLFSEFCCAQQINFADSLSRAKADIVLSQFDSLQVPKLLFSLEDRYYYVLCFESSILKEYFITADSIGKVKSVELIEENAHTKKQKKQLAKDKKLLNELNPFDLSKYQNRYITEVPNATYFTFGKLSYFVIKDTNQTRFGEFHISMPIKPPPIDLNLWAYLIRKLSEQIKYD